MDGEDLTPAQANTMKEIFQSFLEPLSDPSSRCNSCLRCTNNSIGGSAPLDMSRTARFFKSKKGLAVADISKKVQQVFISKSSYPLQLLVWRKNGDPKNPLAYFTIPRLTYGHKSASTLAKMSLEMITEYGEDRCELCKGTFSITNPDKSTIKSCHGVSHAFAYC